MWSEGKGHATTRELAQEFGVSRRTIMHDISHLSYGCPVYIKQGAAGTTTAIEMALGGANPRAIILLRGCIFSNVLQFCRLVHSVLYRRFMIYSNQNYGFP